MPEETRPLDKESAPDPSNNYERSHPEREAGMGRLDNNKSTPTQREDQQKETVGNRSSQRQLNAHDVTDSRADGKNTATPEIAPVQPDHSMHDEEPDGWDQAPNDISDPKQKRHPKTDGLGGTR